ncbi:hypothetical protein FQA39_LY10948 [Lamprigera yunnana]|nr:hypothetical protein FQA39_LY10948 [Lamprigera yunnana]
MMKGIEIIEQIEDDVAETTFADIGDCDLWVPEDEEEDEENEEEDEEEDEENEEEDEENVENKISDSEIEASGISRRTNKAIAYCSDSDLFKKFIFVSFVVIMR